MSTYQKRYCLPEYYQHPKFGCVKIPITEHYSEKVKCPIGMHYDRKHILKDHRGCVRDTHTRVPEFINANRPFLTEDFGKYAIYANDPCFCGINNLYYYGVS